MQESLFSPIWYRYSQQRPQLKAHVVVQQQRYRDQLWYLIINNTNENHFRINASAYAFVGRCNGQYSTQEIWDNLQEQLGHKAPTQDEIIRLLNELDQQDLLRYDVMPDIPNLFRRSKDRAKQQQRSFLNPLAFRLPLWNPTHFLNHTQWLGRLIFNPISLMLWLSIVLIAIVGACSRWDEVFTHAKAYMGTPRYLLIAWASYSFIKAIHEFSHALAVRHWGGEVKETGITLFMLTPAPYVDASAANGFSRRFQRIIVGAIGIMTELFLAALALFIYFNVQPGLVQDIAFVTLFVCSVSTLLFNGNPLLRFDAYYVLCDLFDLPNLATRSRTYWTNLMTKWIVGRKYANPLELAAGERKWLLAYAPLSLLYSLVVLTSVVLWLGAKSFLIGIVGIIYVAFTLVVNPLSNLSKQILSSVPVGVAKLKAKMTILAAMTALVALFFLVPVPSNTVAQGVVWVPDESRIRPETQGFIRELPVENGAEVTPGQVLVVLEDANLLADKEKLTSQLEKLETDQFDVWLTDPAKAASIGEEMKNVKDELRRNDEKIAALTVKSQAAGRLVMAQQKDMLGSFIKKGTVLGYVLNDDPVNVRVALGAHKVQMVRENLSTIDVRTLDHPHEVIPAEVVSIAPASSNKLPSAALGDHGGGDFATDPADKDGINTVEPIVMVDLKLPSVNFERAGVKAEVRFNHKAEPVAKQLLRHFQQLFLRFFNPSS